MLLCGLRAAASGPPLLQNIGRERTGCASYLTSSSSCGNTTAWIGTRSQWVMEPAAGPNRFFIRSVVRARLCDACAFVQAGRRLTGSAEASQNNGWLAGWPAGLAGRLAGLAGLAGLEQGFSEQGLLAG